MIRYLLLSFLALIAGCMAKQEPVFVATAPAPAAAAPKAAAQAASIDRTPTRILDQSAAARLLSNSGLTLQWIGWDKRGTLNSGKRDGQLWLKGVQHAPGGGRGLLTIDGHVTEIGTGYFTFSGEIVIEGTPDAGRICKMRRQDWRFAITEGRKYWRLRQFEWCDGLTDYVDIYF